MRTRPSASRDATWSMRGCASEPADESGMLHPLVHGLLAAVSGTVLTADLFNLYVWFELMLITVLPNCMPPLIVQATLGFSTAVLDAARTAVSLPPVEPLEHAKNPLGIRLLNANAVVRELNEKMFSLLLK